MNFNEEGITMDSIGTGIEKTIEPKESPSAEDILKAIDPSITLEKNEEVIPEVEETEEVVETEEVDTTEDSMDSDVDEEDEESEPNIKINEPQHEQSFMTFKARDITSMIDEMCLPKRKRPVRRFSH